MSITQGKILKAETLKVESKGGQGRNIRVEIHEITIDGSLTTVELATSLNFVYSMAVTEVAASAYTTALQFATDYVITSGAITVSWSGAGTNGKKYRITLLGY